MKKCKCCGETKEIRSFYSHPQCADGRYNKCIECIRSGRSKSNDKPSKEPDWRRATDRIILERTNHGFWPTPPLPATQRAFSLRAA